MMTEVRQVSENNFGLFATKSYDAGDVILEESGLFTFAPTSEDQDRLLKSQLDMFENRSENDSNAAQAQKISQKKSPSMLDIEIPRSVDKKYEGKFRGMLLAAMTFVLFAENDPIKKDKILSLYAPSITSPSSKLEEQIVQLAIEAANYCDEHACKNSRLRTFFSEGDTRTSKAELIKAILVWSCNAFEGGLIYERTSRINHSCDPNSIISLQGDELGQSANVNNQRNQRVLATTRIQNGDEILISYLGSFTYAGGTARLARLEHTKYFVCNCTRCQTCDWSSAIPCSSCHPRTFNSKYLDEEMQYDDEKNVHYAYPKNAQSANLSVRCSYCNESTVGSTISIGNKVAEKVANRMVSQTISNNSKNQKENSIESEVDEQLFQLSSSVLGAKHWCTNIAMLTLLNRTLNSINSAMILSGVAPDLTEIAECIDSLQRLWDFTTGLNLRTPPSHLLAGPTIGVARILISLGDQKSQDYGIEWVSRVEDHVRQGFEGQGMIKVVDAIKGVREKKSILLNNSTVDEQIEESDCMDIGGENKRPKRN